MLAQIADLRLCAPAPYVSAPLCYVPFCACPYVVDRQGMFLVVADMGSNPSRSDFF